MYAIWRNVPRHARGSASSLAPSCARPVEALWPNLHEVERVPSSARARGVRVRVRERRERQCPRVEHRRWSGGKSTVRRGTEHELEPLAHSGCEEAPTNKGK